MSALSDQQLEQLLREAEQRLQSNGPSRSDSTPQVPTLTVDADQPKKQEEQLSVRVAKVSERPEKVQHRPELFLSSQEHLYDDIEPLLGPRDTG